ncbi:MAG: ArnT family glycosyltransferase [Rhodospirillales bacterium]
MKDQFVDRVLPALVAIVFIVLVGLAGPGGDFPLNDDWSYAWSVRELHDEGRLAFTDWVSMPLVAQVLWGWLFTLPAGFSFTALRLSTVVLAVVGGLAVYALVRMASGRRDVATVAALTVLTTPLFFVLSVSFMTDVPSAALMLLGVLLFARDLDEPHGLDYAIAVLACLAATLVRQVALAVPIAYAVAAVYRDGWAPLRLLRAVFPAVLCVGAFVGWSLAIDLWLGRPALYDVQSQRLLLTLGDLERTLLQVALNVTTMSITVGLFVLPAVLCVAAPLWRRLAATFASPGLVLGFLVALLAIPIANLTQGLPLLGNILFDFGLGPRTLKDHYILQLTVPTAAPDWLWPLLTALGMAGAAALIAALAAAIKRAAQLGRLGVTRPRASVELFVAATLLVYVLPLSLTPIFDRYTLIPIALGCILIPMVALAPGGVAVGAARVGAGVVAGLAAVVPLAWFSVAATHDYLAWNRARWAALERVMADRGATPWQIDGGFEFNGWYLHDQAQYGSTAPKRSWWWVSDDRYVASFKPMPGYETILRAPYRSWLWREDRAILVSERRATAQSVPADPTSAAPPPLPLPPEPIAPSAPDGG